MNTPLNINLAVAGAITAALLPVLGVGWTVTTIDEGIGLRLSFSHAESSFWFIIDGSIHMEYHDLKGDDNSLSEKLSKAVENFFWRD